MAILLTSYKESVYCNCRGVGQDHVNANVVQVLKVLHVSFCTKSRARYCLLFALDLQCVAVTTFTSTVTVLE